MATDEYAIIMRLFSRPIELDHFVLIVAEKEDRIVDRQVVKYYDKALTAHQLRRLAEAEQPIKGYRDQSRFCRGYNNLGNVFLDRGRVREATMAYKKQSLMPKHPVAKQRWQRLATPGENEQAIEWLQKALVQDPNYADAYNNLGNALASTGSPRLPPCVSTGLKINPQQVSACTNLGNINLEGHKHFDEAEARFLKT